ncbi:hypothetical protein F0L74_13110 [Chitinophaga agrisoli]|uniref:Outer membrane protein with beta-barrel domain n=1 Tax=Chitinophaga agrisoli TaxID=2607653 RepID=A0A5B2VVV8_9BACT|nr:hypothetical protein [Chitinophaga agrisoli]KAA2243431.1 hypothetical protein F0L74_13110 [Chitinophaga agrisoli]
MKHLLLLLFLPVTPAALNAQNVMGVGLGVHNHETGTLELTFQSDKGRVHLAYTVGPLRMRGIYREPVLEDGYTETSHGYLTSTVDIGYSRFFTDRFNIELCLSLGSRTHYSNYVNDYGEKYYYDYNGRFTAGGGIYLGFFLTKRLELYAGYSSLRDGGGGIRFNLK